MVGKLLGKGSEGSGSRPRTGLRGESRGNGDGCWA